MYNETMNGFMQSGYMGQGMGGGHGWGMFHGPFAILMIAAGIFLLYLLYRLFRPSGGVCAHGAAGDALGILGERYAKGEIDEEEYRARRSVIKSRK